MTTSPNPQDDGLKLVKRHEWIFKGKTFGILVSCRGLDGDTNDKWTWCMYALIYDNHPLFKDAEAAIEQLPWHCGCTYEERFFQEPARGIRYEWQRKGEWLKIGCDYAHLYDDHYQRMSPEGGIPPAIQADAQELFSALLARQESSHDS